MSETSGKIECDERTVELGTMANGSEFLSGHVLDGRNLLPAAAVIKLVWESFAQAKSLQYQRMSVVFENVRFGDAIVLPKRSNVQLKIAIQRVSGRFKVIGGETALATGSIRRLQNPAQEFIPEGNLSPIPDDELLNTGDIYKELWIRGHEYTGAFQGLKSSTIDGKEGRISWHANWVSFLDAMLQLKMLGTERNLQVPASIQKLVIDTKKHQDLLAPITNLRKELQACVHVNPEVIASGGVQISGLLFKNMPRWEPSHPALLEEYRFVAHRDKAEITLQEMMILSSQLVVEAQVPTVVKTVEIIDNKDVTLQVQLVSPMLLEILENLPGIEPQVNLAASLHKYQLPSEVRSLDPKKLSNESNISLAVGHRLLAKDKLQTLKTLQGILRPGGFILTHEDSEDDHIYRTNDLNLHIILEKTMNGTDLLLLRNQTPSREKHSEIVPMESRGFRWLEKAQAALSKLSKNDNSELLLVSQRDDENSAIGLVNCVRKEVGGALVRAVITRDDKAPKFAPDDSFYSEQLALDLPINVLEDGVWGSYRHLPLRPQPMKPFKHVYVDQLERGDFNSVCWMQGPITSPGDHKELIHCVYLSLAGDSIAPGAPDSHLPFGFNFSGVTTTGRRVMGLLLEKGLSNLCIAENAILWDVPNQWSLEDAATIPEAIATYYLALYHLSHVKKGEKILIHSAIEISSQVALTLAIADGCDVFTTIKTANEREFIRKTFPSIPETHISSHDSFEKQIMSCTNNQGVDIVFNTVNDKNEEKMLASIRCLARRGRFIDIDKNDLESNDSVQSLILAKDLSYHSVMLHSRLAESKPFLQNLNPFIQRYIQRLMEKKIVKSLPRNVHQKEHLRDALQSMASGTHVGKALIKMCDDNGPYDTPIQAYPRFYCKANRCYVIFGVNDLSLEVAEWLYTRKATHLILVSQVGLTTSYQKMRVETWKSKGVIVEVIKDKQAWKGEDCIYILKAAENLAPVDGIFIPGTNLGGVEFTKQTVNDFDESLKSGAGIARQLDRHSRIICPCHRYFVVFSSSSCGRGCAGQSSQAYANDIMERICESRVTEGFPGLAIQWGEIDFGEDAQERESTGTSRQKVSSCMQAMEKLLLQAHPVVSSMVRAQKSPETSLRAVLKIIGIKDEVSTEKNTLLSEMALTPVQQFQLKATLEQDFDVFLNSVEFRNLTIEKLLNLMKANSSEDVLPSNISDAGEAERFARLRAIFGFARDSTVSVQSRLDFRQPTKRKDIRLMLIPGIEGTFQLFKKLIPRLNCPVSCLQYAHSDCATIDTLADLLMTETLQVIKDVDNVVLVGYSFGALPAIEMARKLVEYEYKVRLFLIEAEPDCLKAEALSISNTTEEDVDEEAVHNGMLRDIIRYNQPTNWKKVVEMVEKCSTLNEKIEIVFREAPPINPPFSFDSFKRICTGLCKRMYMAATYDTAYALPMTIPITIVWSMMTQNQGVLSENSLQKVTRGQVATRFIDGDHVTLINSPMMGTLLNETFQTYRHVVHGNFR